MSKVQLAWTEYELRRRVHFALELMLSALTDTLIDLNEASVGDVMSDWRRTKQLPPLLSEVCGSDSFSFDLPLNKIEANIPKNAFLNTPLERRKIRELAPCPRALFAVVLLLASARQTKRLISAGNIPNRDSYLERTFSIMEQYALRTAHDALRALLIHTVIEAHLRTTLRKMGQGQKCSLRFYSEGGLLRPTGTPVRAGFSGDRLGNVLGMLSDLGFCARDDNGKFVILENGRVLLQNIELKQ